ALGCPPARRVEHRDDRHRVLDLVALDHPHDLVERKGAHLDKLRRVGRALDRAQPFREVDVGGLLDDALAGVVRAELHEAVRLVPGLFGQLALHRGFLGFAGLRGAGRHLPEEVAGDIAILPDQDDGLRVEERKHADAAGALHDAVEGRPSVGQRDLILADANPGFLVQERGGESSPRYARQLPTIRHDASTSCRPSGGRTVARAVRARNGGILDRMSLPRAARPLWTATESVRADILREAEGLSQGQADWRPSEKSWSVGEVVHHLILAEVATGKLTTKLTREAEAAGGASGFPADLAAFKPFPAPPPRAADAPEGAWARPGK